MGIFLLLLSALVLAAQGPANPATSREWVNDQARMLTDTEQSRLRTLLSRIHNRTGAQVVLLTVPRVDGIGTRDYTTRLFNTWKLGSAEKNDGVLILIVREQHAVEIVIGSGLTKLLPHYLLDDTIRSEIAPALQAGRAADGLAEGIKSIGAKLAGFDRKRQPPILLFAIVAVLGAVLGAIALQRIWAFRKRPQGLPVNICVPATSYYQGDTYSLDRFREDKTDNFYLRQSERPAGGFESFPALWLWCAVAGLTLAAAGLAGFTVALTSTNLEPSLALLCLFLGISLPFTFAGLGSANAGDFDGVPIGAALIAIAGGYLPALFGHSYLWSDFALATYIAPGAAFTVNALIGAYIVNNFYGWVPRRFVCETCGAPVRELTKDEIPKLRPAWDARLPRSTFVDYRGWRCTGPCTGSYVAYSARQKETVCATCKTPTLETAHKDGYRIRTCLLCSSTTTEKLPKQQKRVAGTAYEAAASSSYEPSTPASSSGYDDQWQRDSSNSSYDSSPSSGGSSDGDGASGSW